MVCCSHGQWKRGVGIRFIVVHVQRSVIYILTVLVKYTRTKQYLEPRNIIIGGNRSW